MCTPGRSTVGSNPTFHPTLEKMALYKQALDVGAPSSPLWRISATRGSATGRAIFLRLEAEPERYSDYQVRSEQLSEMLARRLLRTRRSDEWERIQSGDRGSR